MTSQILYIIKHIQLNCREYSKLQNTYILTWREHYSVSAFPVENSFS